MLRAIKTFIKDPPPTDSFADLAPGLNVLEGTVRTSDPIRSPVRGLSCVAFFYRSFLVISGGRAPAIHKIRQVEVYAPFELEMNGGVLTVTPTRQTLFEQRDHRELQKRYGAQFQGLEEVIVPGARVKVRGKAKKTDEGWVLTLKDIEVIEKQTVSEGGEGGKRKKKRKRR